MSPDIERISKNSMVGFRLQLRQGASGAGSLGYFSVVATQWVAAE